MNDSTSADWNPYRPPRSSLDPYLVTFDPSEPVRAELRKSATLYRCVRMWGRLEAELTWNAMGTIEFVEVNGRQVAAKHAFFGSVPHFAFELHAPEHRFIVTVDIRVRWIYWTKAFRITVDHETAYSEGKWS